MKVPRGQEWRSRLGGTAVSIIAHLVGLVLLVTLYHPTPVARRVTMIPLEVGEPLAAPTVQAPPPRRVQPPRAEQRVALPPFPPEVVDIPLAVAAGPVGPRDSVGTGGPAPDTRGRLAPSYGDGRLWIPPVDVLQLGRRLPQAPSASPVGVGQLDSLVTARLLAYLDSMPPDSFAPPRPPSWTTEIGGQTWGMDGRWIYLGPVKLPAALLALLPISLPQGNYDQIRAAADLQRMREDILQAARRADNAAEFNRYVQELRKRRDAERDAKRRVPRDTIIP
ncbi:MAG TPA: hypothetical protein VF970_07185 [Gemmatimonadales bacterium]